MPNKILTLDELADKSADYSRQGQRVVLCHGTFDLMHAGHIRHLQQARAAGDVLLVTVTADAYVNKGPGRPVFSDTLRVETLAALACVDHVAVNHDVTSIELIKKVKPSLYVKGSDYKSAENDLTGNITHEAQAVQEGGGEIFFTDDITFSSSTLLNEHFGVFSSETRDYLRKFNVTYQNSDVIGMLKTLGELKVLVVGDAIVDEYHYTTPLGQTGKGNVLAVKYNTQEQFAGGSIAVANHVAGFVKDVTLVAGLGKTDSHEAFIRSKLAENITPIFFYREDAPTVVKRRFVDADMAKLFEVYFFNEDPMPETLEVEICAWLEEKVAEFDVVMVPDYGNGFITNAMIQRLCDHSRFLAVNTQINSGNRGYHVISRYRRADFISLNEPELRLAAHSRQEPLEDVAEYVGSMLSAPYMAVTRGTKGVFMADRKHDKRHVTPALSTKVLDRIGAGDAFLSLASLCLGAGMPSEIASFVGSAAAALDVQIVCNREPISSVILFKYITTLLKWS